MSKWEHKRAVFESERLRNGHTEFSHRINAIGEYVDGGAYSCWCYFCAALDHMEAEDKKLARSEILHANKLSDGTLWYVGCPLHIHPENFFTKSGTFVKAQLVEVQQGEQSHGSDECGNCDNQEHCKREYGICVRAASSAPAEPPEWFNDPMKVLARGSMINASIDGLRISGISRVDDNEKAVLLHFARKPSDDELRVIHECVRSSI